MFRKGMVVTAAALVLGSVLHVSAAGQGGHGARNHVVKHGSGTHKVKQGMRKPAVKAGGKSRKFAASHLAQPNNNIAVGGPYVGLKYIGNVP